MSCNVQHLCTDSAVAVNVQPKVIGSSISFSAQQIKPMIQEKGGKKKIDVIYEQPLRGQQDDLESFLESCRQSWARCFDFALLFFISVQIFQTFMGLPPSQPRFRHFQGTSEILLNVLHTSGTEGVDDLKCDDSLQYFPTNADGVKVQFVSLSREMEENWNSNRMEELTFRQRL